MKKIEFLSRKLKPGKVYRRADLVHYSKAVDRHLRELVKIGMLDKLAHGLYYVPKHCVFGKAPADDKVLISVFLKTNRFVIISPNEYNSLGLGTTQLYNTRFVYNCKRQGDFKLGNRVFQFVRKSNVPKKVTKEFLIVDLVNNLKLLHEDQSAVLQKVKEKVKLLDKPRLEYIISRFGTVATQKLFYTIKNYTMAETYAHGSLCKNLDFSKKQHYSIRLLANSII